MTLLSLPAMPRLPLLALTLLLGAPLVAAQPTFSPEIPVRDQPVTVTFEAPADEARVIYRPGSVAADTVVLATSGAEVTFSPEQAGVVRVEAGDEALPLSVRFPSAPLSGLFVMIGAGMILFGGAAFAMRALLSGDKLPDLSKRADT